MDPRYGTPRAVDAVDPTASYDSWPTLPSTRPEVHSRCCCRSRLSWTVVSVVEIALILLTAVFYFFFTKMTLKQLLPAGTGKDDQITELAEWMLRMVGSMICVQVIDEKNMYCSILGTFRLSKQKKGANNSLRQLILYIHIMYEY